MRRFKRHPGSPIEEHDIILVDETVEGACLDARNHVAESPNQLDVTPHDKVIGVKRGDSVVLTELARITEKVVTVAQKPSLEPRLQLSGKKTISTRIKLSFPSTPFENISINAIGC